VGGEAVNLWDLERWARSVEERRPSAGRCLALVALQRAALRLGLEGGPPAQIRRQALEALSLTVAEVHRRGQGRMKRSTLAAMDGGEGARLPPRGTCPGGERR
jgi:hypothetical protein